MKNFILGISLLLVTAFTAKAQTYAGSVSLFTVNSGWNVVPNSTNTTVNFTVRMVREQRFANGVWGWAPFNMNLKVGVALAPGSGVMEYLSPVYNVTSSNFSSNNAIYDATFSFSVASSKLLDDHHLVLYYNIPNNGSTYYQHYGGTQINNPPPAPTGPVNDNYSGAINLTAGASMISGTTVDATQSPQDQTPCGYGNDTDDDVWYKFVATSTSHAIRLSDVNFNNIQPYDTPPLAGIALYNSSLGYLGCDNVNKSITTASLVIGQTYYIRIWTHNAKGNKRMTYKIALSLAPNNFITEIIWQPSTWPNIEYKFTAMFSHDSGIPLSDIAIEWDLVTPPTIEADSWGFSLVPGSSTDIVYLEGTDGDTAIRIRGRMKQISTNLYISDWFIRSGLIWWN